MGLDDIIDQGKQFLAQGKQKIDQAVHSEKIEEISDGLLNAAAEAAKKVAPDGIDSKIDEVRDQIDDRISE